jgi:dTDP-4-amino-4,6-dideoxygalactose transaminase
MINVTKTYLPPLNEYIEILKRAWNKSWITNNGELVQELEQKLKDYLSVDQLFFCSNGTVVLQIALKALNITQEVITTPFSYVATANSILWEGCKPVFVDIEPSTFCIDTSKIESAITEKTQAILATHVYGIPCDVEAIEIIAQKYGLKVIYDGAHAFGVMYKGRPLLSYGDINTCSFHATKLFHTVEGGCIICRDGILADKILLYRQFGHIGENYFSMGINAKNSEFHAAMGLAILPQIEEIIYRRKKISELYSSLLNMNKLSTPKITADTSYNYAYYPVIFEQEKNVLEVKEALLQNGVSARRYFYPSLNQLPFVNEYQSCAISESISKRVLTLPLYYDLADKDIERIVEIINQHL